MAPELQSAVFLPLSAQTDDPGTITWCRGVPLLIAEELQRLQIARASFAAWTTGKGASFRLCHLQTDPPAGHVAAYARAARARVGISGWGSWQGDPLLRWEVVDADGSSSRKVPVDTRAGASCLDVVRMGFESAKLLLGLMDDRPGPVLDSTRSDTALLAWLQDREQVWYRRRRGMEGPYDGEYRYLLSALTHDPGFEPAARQLLRRAGGALTASGDARTPAQKRATDAIRGLLRVRPGDHVCWTLLGMLERGIKRPDEAETALRRATALAQDYAPAHRELGNLMLQSKDLRKAGAHLRRAGKLSPHDPEIQFSLGTLYLELKSRARAAQHLQVVLRLAPNTQLSKMASKLLLDLDDGPMRRPTNALNELVPAKNRTRDRDLIARTFGLRVDLDAEDITSPGDDFLDRLDDEATAWPTDDSTNWTPD